MKTTFAALAIVLGLLPALASADPISGALNDAIQQEAISDSISDAIGGSSDGVYSQPLNDAITGPNGVYSDDLNDVLIGNNGNGQPGTNGYSRDASVQIAKALKCFVMGTPSVFPDDLRIRNASVVALPAGTELKWQVGASGDVGYAVLDHVLRPGETLRLSGVLADGVKAGTACAARII